jgi:hypothetical protein
MGKVIQEHTHVLSIKCKDGVWVKYCLCTDCHYEKEIKMWEFYESDM